MCTPEGSGHDTTAPYQWWGAAQEMGIGLPAFKPRGNARRREGGGSDYFLAAAAFAVAFKRSWSRLRLRLAFSFLITPPLAALS